MDRNEAIKIVKDHYPVNKQILNEALEFLIPELKESEDEMIRKSLIDMLKNDEKCYLKEIAWLEKQGEQSQKTSIWKHWRDGICGNGEGKLIYLIKNGYDYSLSSCLCFECDYIELSELDNLMLEKQGGKDKLIKELGEYKIKYTQEVLEKHLNSMNNKDDKRLRKTTISFLKDFADKGYENAVECIDWLEKQGNTNETINRDEFAQGVLRGAAINLITWIDYNVAKGNMCLSNMECKDIEDALVSGDWDKIYAYMKKKLEKPGEQKPVLEMKTPEESLGIDSETYSKIVDECIYGEQKPADKVEPKFKVGDKIQYSKGCGTIMTIEKIENGEYIFANNMGHTTIESGNKWYLVEQKPTEPINIVNRDFEPKSAEEAAKELPQDNRNYVEQKPKFKVGDWITNGYCNILITSVDNIYYCHANNTIDGDIESIDKQYHLWTIQDAKDGDVLSYRDGQWIFIYKNYVDDNSFEYYALYSTIHQDLTINDAGFTLLGDAITPATKEQHDALMKAIVEAGYIFDFEEKELKKIEQKPSETQADNNPAWSEEDEEMFNELIRYFKFSISYNGEGSESAEKWKKRMNWFKSLKDKVQSKLEWSKEDDEIINFIKALCDDKDDVCNNALVKKETDRIRGWLESFKDRAQPKQEWSEEDERSIRDSIFYLKSAKKYFEKDNDILWDEKWFNLCIEWLESLYKRQQQWSEEDKTGLTNIIIMLKEGASIHFNKKDITKALDWLKSLKERVQPQLKQEWSEEDDEHLERILKELENQYQKPINRPYLDKIESDYNWLKSLKPQNKWKPSEEQLKALKEIIDVGHFTSYPNALETLYEQLKKLK